MWSWATAAPLKPLDQPSVVEVICGFWFAPLELDPVVVGAYWDSRKAEFPRRQLHPAIERVPGLIINTAPRMRVWLLTEDESQLIQIQNDRFYLNWRRTSPTSSYPRFSGPGGLCERSLAEFQRFASFCERTVGQQPGVDRVELGKVDHFQEGECWNGLPDLGVMLPDLAPMLRYANGDSPALTLRFQDQIRAATLKVAIDTTTTMSPGQPSVRGLRIDTTVSLPLDNESSESRFVEANGIVNSVFATMIPEHERKSRFMKKDQSL